MLAIYGLVVGFVLFVCVAIPPLWHHSEESRLAATLRYTCLIVATILIVMGLMPIIKPT